MKLNTMNTCAVLGLFLATTFSSAGALASVEIFKDDFDDNSLGLAVVPSGWSVTDGSVDVIGAGGIYDLLPGNGLYLDLDGHTSNAGRLSRSFDLDAGVLYSLSFRLAGSQRGTAEVVDVSFGNVFETFALSSNEGFLTRTLQFTPSIAGTYSISFENRGGDRIGALLDSVSVSAVPEPESWALLCAGLGLIGVAASRRRTLAMR